MQSRELGAWGEEQAAKYLKKKGYTVVDRNFRCRSGEIDIIAKDRDYIVFAEVKLRKNDDFGSAMEFVTPAKQRRIIKTAQMWLLKNETELQPRFDVIEVYNKEGLFSLRPEINHIENAFW